jgi:hypothetical protein
MYNTSLFFNELIKNNPTIEKKSDLISFYNLLHYKNYVIKKKVKKIFTLNNFLMGGVVKINLFKQKMMEHLKNLRLEI